MSSITWTPTALAAEARRWAGEAWRMVEAQHAAATMKLVDSAEEQLLLEDLLDEELDDSIGDRGDGGRIFSDDVRSDTIGGIPDRHQ